MSFDPRKPRSSEMEHGESRTFGREESRVNLEELRRTIESQDLPVRDRLPELVQGLVGSVDRKGIFLLQGETGSGKTVYSFSAVREALRELGLPDKVVAMEPKKDAAEEAATAHAAVAGEKTMGGAVGFATSEVRGLHASSAVRVVTPGIFIRYLQQGTLTKKDVGALIIDEIHEGSIEYDLTFGLIKLMQERGESPLVLMTSATLNKEKFQKFYGVDDQDFMSVEGKPHPITVENADPDLRLDQNPDGEGYLFATATRIVEEAQQLPEGDILVFLPGVYEIRDVHRRIQNQIPQHFEIKQLHGQIERQERQEVRRGSRAGGLRRIILSTNAAETSVTVPGVRSVIDTGRQRISQFNPDTGVKEIRTVFISKAQRVQRMGRAGRTAPGRYLEVYDAKTFESMPSEPIPEINRVDLTHLVLQLKGQGFEPETFPFFEQPNPEKIKYAVQELKQLGALDEHGVITDLGKEMSDLRFEPGLARMVIEAKKSGCTEQALVIAAFDRESDVFVNLNENTERDRERIRRRKRFDNGGSDYLQRLHLFEEALDHGVIQASACDRTPLGREATDHFNRWCYDHGLKADALKHIAYRLGDYAMYANVDLDLRKLYQTLRTSSDDESINRVIVAGHASQIYYLDDRVRSGRGGVYRRLGGDQVVEISAYSSAYSLEMLPFLIVGSVPQEVPGRRTPVIDTVHPILLETLVDVLPQSIQRGDGKECRLLLNALGEIEAKIVVYAPGTRNELGLVYERATGPEATKQLAVELCRGANEFLAPRNSDALKRIHELAVRSHGRVTEPDLEQWYSARLRGATSLHEVRAIEEQLLLRVEDFCDKKMEAAIDRVCPLTVSIPGGAMRSVTYQLASEGTATPVAVVAVMQGDIDKIAIDTFDGIIGSAAFPVSIELAVGYRSPTPIEQIEALKDSLETPRIDEVFRTFTYRFEHKKTVDVSFDTGVMPTIESLGLTPIAFTKDRRGGGVYAYPALRLAPSRYGYSLQGTVGDRSVEIVYFKNKPEADRATVAFQQEYSAQQEFLAREKKRDVDLLEFKRLEGEVQRAIQDCTDEPAPGEPSIYASQSGFADRFRAAQLGVYDRMRNTYQHADALSGLEILREIQSVIQRRREYAVSEEGVAHLAENLKQKMSQMLDDFGYLRYGLTANKAQELRDSFVLANEDRQTSTAQEMPRVRTLFKAIETELKGLYLVPGGEAAVQYGRLLADPRTIRFVVRDGKFVRAEYPATTVKPVAIDRQMTITEGEREIYIMRNTLHVSNKQGVKSVTQFPLTDGTYVIDKTSRTLFLLGNNSKSAPKQVYATYQPESHVSSDRSRRPLLGGYGSQNGFGSAPRVSQTKSDALKVPLFNPESVPKKILRTVL